MCFFKRVLFFVLVTLSFGSCSHSQSKINGASIVSPPNSVSQNCYSGVKKINANWVAVIPFAFTSSASPQLHFNQSNQWWGEKTEGVLTLVEYAKQQNLKVMLKPHVWCRGKWIGDFELKNDEDWLQWEKDYTRYILHYANIAAEKKVELFCIGTELKKVVLKRPQFFVDLIKKVKKVYKGKLTYAANWDNFQNIPFWQALDYIGIDAYFSLSEQQQPTVNTLNKAWLPIKEQLKTLSVKNKKPILFTEYGFESCDYNTKDTWGSLGKQPENQKAQVNAYQSYFDTFYDEDWFAGGFFWKWHLIESTKRDKAKSFTPQNKEVIKVLKTHF